MVSAPSGAGKTTICRRVCELDEGLCYSVSATTRPTREGEVEGKDYFFLTEDEFKEKIKKNEFLEWAKVHNHYYGTLYSFVNNCFGEKKDVILDIDVQGGLKTSAKFRETALIFVLPPSWDVLESRLRLRGKDGEEEIKKRLNNACKEIGYLENYDYLVINDRLEKAVREIQAIIVAERSKTRMFKEKILEWNKQINI